MSDIIWKVVFVFPTPRRVWEIWPMPMGEILFGMAPGGIIPVVTKRAMTAKLPMACRIMTVQIGTFAAPKPRHMVVIGDIIMTTVNLAKYVPQGRGVIIISNRVPRDIIVRRENMTQHGPGMVILINVPMDTRRMKGPRGLTHVINHACGNVRRKHVPPMQHARIFKQPPPVGLNIMAANARQPQQHAP